MANQVIVRDKNEGSAAFGAGIKLIAAQASEGSFAPVTAAIQNRDSALLISALSSVAHSGDYALFEQSKSMLLLLKALQEPVWNKIESPAQSRQRDIDAAVFRAQSLIEDRNLSSYLAVELLVQISPDQLKDASLIRRRGNVLFVDYSDGRDSESYAYQLVGDKLVLGRGRSQVSLDISSDIKSGLFEEE
jgi:hypothetical protein